MKLKKHIKRLHLFISMSMVLVINCFGESRMTSSEMHGFPGVLPMPHPVYQNGLQLSVSLAKASEASLNGKIWKGNQMNFNTSQVLLGTMLAATFISGYWIHSGGLPPATLPLAVHKFAVLGDIILVNRMYFKHEPVQSPETIALVAMDAFYLASMVTGGWMAIIPDVPAFVRTTHQITPWLSLGSTGVLLALLK